MSSFFTIQTSINFSQPFMEYAPCNAGLGGEPATTVASMIRNTFISAPLTWHWNRESLKFPTVQGTQDYYIVSPDFGFMENWSLTATQNAPGIQTGKVFQGNDQYNYGSLQVSADSQRPDALAVQSTYDTQPFTMTITSVAVDSNNVLTILTANTSTLAVGQSVTFSGVGTASFLNGQTVVVTAVTLNTSFTAAFTHASYGPTADTGTASVPYTSWVWFRFLGVPNNVYNVNVTYQKRAAQNGPYFITSCGNAAAGNTTYNGAFDPLSFPAGATATITGFKTNAGNDGSFTVVSCSSTQLVVVNGAGVAETISAYAANLSWAPIPDQYSHVYNNLFLSEMLSSVDEAKAQIYRQRGVAAFLAKSSGLSETQKKAFIAQWLMRQVEEISTPMLAQQGNQARGV